jgi:DNA-binding CsgD family transcriptional regulator
VVLFPGLEEVPRNEFTITRSRACAATLMALRVWHPGHLLPSDLTERQLDIVRGISSGTSYRAVGDRLGITASTAECYAARLRDKLGAPTNAHVARWADRNGVADIWACNRACGCHEPHRPRRGGGLDVTSRQKCFFVSMSGAFAMDATEVLAAIESA